jgi:hypothetical protein
VCAPILSYIELTAVSMRDLQVYAPKTQQAEYAKAVQSAANWLAAAQPKTGEDRACVSTPRPGLEPREERNRSETRSRAAGATAS